MVSKAAITRLKDCDSIAREYENVPSRLTLVDSVHPPDPSSWSLILEPPVGPTIDRTDCSNVRKRVLWRSLQRPGSGRRIGTFRSTNEPELCQWLPMGGEGDQGECNNIVHNMMRRGEEIIVNGDSEGVARERKQGQIKRSTEAKRSASLWKVSSSTLQQPSSLFPILTSINLSSLDEGGDVIPPHACMQTPICQLPSIVSTIPLPPPPPPPTPVCGQACNEHLSLALSADALAGVPIPPFHQSEPGASSELVLEPVQSWFKNGAF